MKFEYLVKDLQVGGIPADKLQEQFDQFANEGWELVSTLPRQNQFFCLVFKRPDAKG